MNKVNPFKEGEDQAEKVRRELKLGAAPIRNIFTLLEDRGVFLVRMPILGKHLSGAFYYDQKSDITKVLINSNRSLGHQQFTAAHEFAHFLMDKDKIFILEDKNDHKAPYERRADAFAANFLLPNEGVHFYVKKTLGRVCKLENIDIVKIRNEFGVSWTALIYRLHDLGYKFDKPYKEKVKETAFLNAIAREVGFEPELPTEDGPFKLPADFNQRAFSAYFNKKISINRLANIIRKPYDETKDLVFSIKKYA